MLPLSSEAREIIVEETPDSQRKTPTQEKANPFTIAEILAQESFKNTEGTELVPNFRTESEPSKIKRNLFARSPLTDAKILESKKEPEKLFAESCFDIREFMSNRNS